MSTALEKLRNLKQQANFNERTLAIKAAIDRIAGRWGNLTYEAIKERFPEIYQRAVRMEERLDQVCIDCRMGNATQQDFEKALSDWEAAHMESIRKMG